MLFSAVVVFPLVHRDVQGDLAIGILTRIDGVKAVHPDLARL